MLPHFGDTDDHLTGVTLWPCEANTFNSFPIAMWKQFSSPEFDPTQWP